MDAVSVGIIGLCLFFVFLFVGLPIGTTMVLVGSAGIWYLLGIAAALTKLATTPFVTIANYDWSVLPLFLFMAYILFEAGLGKDLYGLAAAWLGPLPGGLAMATMGACGIFASISASSVATAATIGLVALPEMRRYNYATSLTTGSIACGGTIGILIPPSSMLIFYGILTETSIGKLFTAAIIPGILQCIFYIIVVYIICRRNPSLGPALPGSSYTSKIRAFGTCWEVLLLVILVLGGLIVGWFTPTESGALGAFGAIILSLIRKRFDWKKLREAGLATVKTTGMIYFIVIGAMIFKYFMAVTTIPTALANGAAGLSWPPLAVVILIVSGYIVLGTAMEEASMIFLTIPIISPVVFALGFDPIWFGIIVTRMMQIGMISPPVGINLFVIQDMSKEPLQTVYKGVMPFIYADIVHVAMLLFFPGVVFILPKLIY